MCIYFQTVRQAPGDRIARNNVIVAAMADAIRIQGTASAQQVEQQLHVEPQVIFNTHPVLKKMYYILLISVYYLHVNFFF